MPSSSRSNQSEGVFPPYSPENFPAPRELRCPHCFGYTEQDRDDENTRVCRVCQFAYKTYWLKSLWMGARPGDEWKFNHPEIRAFLHERGLDTFGNPFPDPGDTDEQIANAAERQQRHEKYQEERREAKARAEREHEAQMEAAWQRYQQLKREEYQQSHPGSYERPYGYAAPSGTLDAEWERRMSQQWGELERYLEKNVRPMWEQQMAQIPDRIEALIQQGTIDIEPIDIEPINVEPGNRNRGKGGFLPSDEPSNQQSETQRITGKLNAENKRWSVRKYVEIGIGVAILVVAVVCSIVFHLPS